MLTVGVRMTDDCRADLQCWQWREWQRDYSQEGGENMKVGCIRKENQFSKSKYIICVIFIFWKRTFNKLGLIDGQKVYINSFGQ